ncbi:MAG: Lpg1974 family pore-forming outer membrane protein [Thermoguttaceae bacterium]
MTFLVAGVSLAVPLWAQSTCPVSAGDPSASTSDLTDEHGVPLAHKEASLPLCTSDNAPWFTRYVCPSDGCGGACADLCNRCGAFGYADYLNWSARRKSLDYAAVVDPTQLANPKGFTPLATESLAFSRTGGARLGIGYAFSNGWDVSWNYTYFRTHGENSIAATPGALTGVLATQSFFNTTPMDFVEADGSLQLQIHDAEAGWHSLLSDSVGFRAFGGFRYATLEQEFNNSYGYTLGGTPVDGTINLHTNMDAEGIRFGAELQWHSTQGFYVFGRGATSLLVATFHTQQQESDSLHGSIVDVPESATQVVPVLEAAAGLGWCHGPWELSAGYEMSNWFNMVAVNRPSENLLIDGFFFHAGWSH